MRNGTKSPRTHHADIFAIRRLRIIQRNGINASHAFGSLSLVARRYRQYEKKRYTKIEVMSPIIPRPDEFSEELSWKAIDEVEELSWIDISSAAKVLIDTSAEEPTIKRSRSFLTIKMVNW